MSTTRIVDIAALPGARETEERAAELALRLPTELAPLARIALDYRWAWDPDGPELFRALDPHAWEINARNPVRQLSDLTTHAAEVAASHGPTLERIARLSRVLEEDRNRPETPVEGLDGPVVFVCAEFGVHPSLPIYSGGLGALAGDILKAASDLALPVIGVGLLYRKGYFQQRVDRTGLQHEYWTQIMPERLPTVHVLDADGAPLTLTFEFFGRDVAFHVWRAEIGRVPLYLLDAELEVNDPVDRWITARLYEGNPFTRLGQYGLLGLGTVHALRALGIEPGVLHFNEGHPALAALELAAEQVADGVPLDDALAAARARCVFTTHTPVPAGNETYETASFVEAFGDLPGRLGMDTERFLDLCRTHPGSDEWPGMTPLALRLSRRANAVSLRHGEVAREMWRPLFGDAPADDVPITHVTNGVHLPTFLSPPMRALLDRHLGDGWLERASAPETWAPVAGHPRRGAVGGPQRVAAAARRLREGQVRPGSPPPRRGPGGRDGGRRDVRRGHLDPGLRAADRDVQAPLPPHVRPRAGAADLRRRPAAADGRGRQGPPARRQREADARRRLRPLAGGGNHGRASPSSRTTTSPWRRRSSAAATCGSTSRGRRSRRAGRAG